MFIKTIILLFFFLSFLTYSEEYKFDNLERLVDVQYENGAIRKFTYDILGNIISDSVFTKKTKVTISSSQNGSTTPSGDVFASKGDTITVVSTPDTGYHFLKWVVSDSLNVIDSGDTGRILVNGSGSINAEFEINMYNVNVRSSVGGNVIPSGDTIIAHGDTLLVTSSADLDYAFSKWDITGDIEIIDSTSIGKFIITDTGTIQAIFLQSFEINAIAYFGGTISPSGILKVPTGSSQKYLILEDEGYQIDSVLVDNTDIGDVSDYTFTNIQSNHTIEACFSENLIKNGKFTQGYNYWSMEKHSNNQFDTSITNGVYSCTITNLDIADSTEIWKIQLKQRIVLLKPDTEHLLSFYCKGTIPKIIFDGIIDKSPWNVDIGFWELFYISDVWTRYETVCKTNNNFNANIDTNKVCFHIATSTGDFSIDNIRLIEKTAGITFTKTVDQTIKEDSSIVLTLAMTDAKEIGNTNLTIIPTGSINYTVNQTTIIPSPNYNGSLAVPIRVTNGVDTTNSVSMNIIVLPVNDAPVATIPSAVTIQPNKLFNQQMEASDVDGDTLNWAFTGTPPTGVTLSSSGQFSWTPDNNQLGTYLIDMIVSDHNLNDTIQFSITVDNTSSIIEDNNILNHSKHFLDAIYSPDGKCVVFYGRNLERQRVTIKVFDALANLLWEEDEYINLPLNDQWVEFSGWNLINRQGRIIKDIVVLIVFKGKDSTGNQLFRKKLVGINSKY